YRYFSTPRRKFIIADAPGHEQYTRNMATGSSTAELALILVDARKGILRQTRRHTLISWLMGIRRMIVVVNKMDLVDFDLQTFHSIQEEFNKFSGSLRNTEFYFVPLRALTGEAVVRSNGRMPWYDGPSLLGLLETLPAKLEAGRQFRFPVQMVLRPNQDFRGYAGQVGSGTIRPGQEVLALPSKQRTTIKEVLLYNQALEEASPPQSVVLTTTDHIDLGRGDMLVSADGLPTVSSKITSYLIWMSHTPLHNDTRYLIKHTTRVLCGRISRLKHKIDVNTLETADADILQFNEIGEVQIDLQSPIFCDPYESDRSTGSFIVIDL